tara:strand:- start:445 stop:699 length:255 start_codon:yes stop_codon:yes gene_type:complete
MKSKEHEQNQKNNTHEMGSNHTEKKHLDERPFYFLRSSIKITFIVYIVCTIIVAIVLFYCGFSILHAPLLTLVLLLALLMIGYI